MIWKSSVVGKTWYLYNTSLNLKKLFNNYSSSPNGLWVDSPWGRRPNYSIDPEAMRARGIIVLVKSNYPGENVCDTSCLRWGNVTFKLTPLPPWTVLGVTSQTLFTYLVHFKDLNFVCGGGGGSLVKAVFMSVYRRLAANSIQNQVKKGRCPKIFWPGL